MEVIIRTMQPTEYPLLEEFLYQAIFQRDLENLIPRTEIYKPEVHVYIEDFGQQIEDYCLCAETAGKIVGAVWVRNIEGFGSIDDQTPEFSISLLPEYRGQGIGTALMKQMLAYLKQAEYSKTSLAVQKDNYALQMYQNVGFTIVDENEQEYIMVCFLEELSD
ncbi:N-acetyltransferase family protein [Enterococcus sp. AZ072]|uniref:GNAT family N-acetyltransferase n=1 Tax=unclassified Enterococcus TaxID=2608891 RepID=UPI003D2DD97E